MALLNTQTIFNLLITLIVGAALYYYIRYKFRVLELTQREHAKVLQSVIMSMNNTQGHGGPSQYVNDMRAVGVGGHVLSDINQDIERFKQVNSEELIDVSDDDEDEDDSDSESGSGSGVSDSESGSTDSNSDSDSSRGAENFSASAVQLQLYQQQCNNAVSAEALWRHLRQHVLRQQLESNDIQTATCARRRRPLRNVGIHSSSFDIVTPMT